MTSDDRISAWLDGEMPPDEAARFEAGLAADPDLATEVEAVAGIRRLLHTNARVPLGDQVLERIVAVVGADTEGLGSAAGVGAASLSARRRKPTLAAVAAASVIIASVVGGLGGSTTLPALGDLVARHAAAAASADDMPPSDNEVMADAMADGPMLPTGHSMAHAWRSDEFVHLMYAAPDGTMMSVFRQEGDTDVARVGDEMGGKGDVGQMAGTPMWSGSVSDTHVAVFDGDGFLWTIVGDADHDTMEAMMAVLPSREPSLGERIRDAADAIVEPFRLGW